MKIAAFSIADYAEATEGMPHDVERLFFRILMKMYAREGGLPNDDRDNARMFGYTPGTFRKLLTRLIQWPAAGIYIQDDEIKNKRVESELPGIQEKREARRIAGKSGGISEKKTEKNPKKLRKFRKISFKMHQQQPSKSNTYSKHSPTPSPTKEKIDKKESNRGARLPSDWKLSEDDRNWVLVNVPAFPVDRIPIEELRFRNHWHAKAGQAACKRDWSKTWQNWILKANDDLPRHSKSTKTREEQATDNWFEDMKRSNGVGEYAVHGH